MVDTAVFTARLAAPRVLDADSSEDVVALNCFDIAKVTRDANSKGDWRWTLWTEDNGFVRLWDKHRHQRSPIMPIPVRVWMQ